MFETEFVTQRPLNTHTDALAIKIVIIPNLVCLIQSSCLTSKQHLIVHHIFFSISPLASNIYAVSPITLTISLANSTVCLLHS